ncbi:MAG: helix-turn-helix transcriptional regulator [Pseudomonadales bacterium]|nr:helix-turn-helix transcriptional regulator [Pseudomonadales bacterium]
MQESFKDIQDYMCRRRDERDLLQEQLADALIAFNDEFKDIDAQAISRWERGKISPSIQRQVLMMQFFGDEPQHILADKNFNIGQLRNLDSFEKLLNQNMEFSHVLGAHPYVDRRADFEKVDISKQKSLHYATQIACFQDNLSRQRDHWDGQWLADILAFDSTTAIMYEVNGLLSGHLILLRVKPEYLEALLHYRLDEMNLNSEHLASVDAPGFLYSLSLYSGTKEIHIDINAMVLSIIAEDNQLECIAARARSDVGVKTLELLGADYICAGEELKGKKEGVKLNGRRYKNLSYKISREKILASSLSINLSRQ